MAEDGSNLIDELLSKAGSAVGQIPVVGNIAKMGQSILTGPEGSQLTPTDQLTRALMSTAALASVHPETYLSLLSAYQTHDVNLAATRRALLQSDALHQDWTRARAQEPNKTSDLEVWHKHIHPLYPELIGYNPIMQDGKVALPASVSEQNSLQARQLAQNTPPGQIVKSIKADQTKGVSATYGPMDVHAGEYPEGMLTGPFADPSLQAKVVSGHFIPVATQKGPNGVQYYRLEQTEAGEDEAARSKQRETVSGGLEAQGIVPGAGPAPGAGAAPPPGAETAQRPGESPTQYKQRLGTVSAREKAAVTQTAKTTQEAEDVNTAYASMQQYIVPDAFVTSGKPSEALGKKLAGIAPGRQMLGYDLGPRQDYLANLELNLPKIVRAGGVNRFSPIEVQNYRAQLADPRAPQSVIQKRWDDLVSTANARVAEGYNADRMASSPVSAHGLTPEQRKKLEAELK